jgi:serine/threonine protein phosphatase PrpC
MKAHWRGLLRRAPPAGARPIKPLTSQSIVPIVSAGVYLAQYSYSSVICRCSEDGRYAARGRSPLVDLSIRHFASRSPNSMKSGLVAPTDAQNNDGNVTLNEEDIDCNIKVSAFSIMGRRPHMEDEYVVSKDRKLVGVFDGHNGAGVAKLINKHLEKEFQRELVAALRKGANALPDAKSTSGSKIDQSSDPAQRPHPHGQLISQVFENVTSKLDDEVMQIRPLHQVGSTFCSVYINRDTYSSPVDLNDTTGFPYQIISCNIGDSRAILSRNGKAIELTVDHKPELPSEKSRIEKLGGYLYWHGDKTKDGKPIPNTGVWRVNGNLALSRAIGTTY